MKKVVVTGASLLILGLIGFWIYKSYSSNLRQQEALSIIPTDAVYVLETSDPLQNWGTFSNSVFWSKLKSHPTLKELAADAEYLDNLSRKNEVFLNLLGQRNFYLSAHLTSPSDYDFLFLLDLKKLNPDLSTSIISLLTDKEMYRIREDDYNGITILSLKDNTTGDELFIAPVSGYLVLSYTDDLVLNTIDRSLQKNATPSPLLQRVVEETTKAELARCYVNYAQFRKFIPIYMTLDSDLLKGLSNNFSYTGLDIYLGDEFASLEGYTSITDSSETYSHLLQKYGGSAFEFDEIISARTAFLLALGIDDVPAFYQELLSLRSAEKASSSSYKNVKNKVEKVLGLSLEKDILPWIGEEIVLAQHKPSSLHRQDDDLLLAIKADNLYFAKEKLQKIQRAIKKRTPARFKKLKYKVYDIYYLDINNLFGLFFGEAFSKIDKPYYTILGEYIIFSTDPKTLIATIEDFENGYTLANDTYYKKIRKDLPDESTLFTYTSGSSAYDALKPKITRSNLSSYRSNKPYLTFFDGIGLSYTSHSIGFQNNCSIYYGEKEQSAASPINTEALARDFLETYSSELANLSDVETFVLNELEDGKFKQYYSGTNQLKFEAETKDGKLHGSFTAYYPDGKTKSKGNYRKGKKRGTWKYYAISGKLLETKREGW